MRRAARLKRTINAVLFAGLHRLDRHKSDYGRPTSFTLLVGVVILVG